MELVATFGSEVGLFFGVLAAVLSVIGFGLFLIREGEDQEATARGFLILLILTFAAFGFVGTIQNGQKLDELIKIQQEASKVEFRPTEDDKILKSNPWNL